MSMKRRREQPNVNTQLVEIYEDLASEKDQVRLKAAIALLSTTSIEVNPSSEHVKTVLKRLIRGLCSGRKAARLGFSVTLTELLAQRRSLGAVHIDGFNWGISEVVQLLEEQTTVYGSVSGQEERDYHLGRLFGSEAVIQSKILFQSTVEIDQWQRVLDIVYQLARKKSWLREQCGWVLTKVLRALQLQEDGIQYAQILLERLCVHGLAGGPEGVAIWMIASKLFPKIPKPLGVWHCQDPLSRVQELKRAFTPQGSLTKEMQENSAHLAQNGSWNSKPHFAWDVVLGTLLENGAPNLPDGPQQITFQDFWAESVDNTLFAMASSNERKYWGFQISQRYIQDAPKKCIQAICGKNYIRCLLHQVSHDESYLHQIARQNLDAIFLRVLKEPEVATAIIGALLAPQGHDNFILIIQNDLFERILSQVDFRTMRTILPLFDRWILRPHAPDEKTALSRRQVIIDILLGVLRPRPIQKNSHRTDTEHHSVASQFLATLTRHAYFQIREDEDSLDAVPEPPFSSATREMFKSRILSCLTNLSIKGSDACYPYDAVCNIHKWEKQSDLISAVFEEDDISSKSIRRAWKALRKIHSQEQSVDPERTTQLNAFKLLLSTAVLQVYNGDTDAVNLLDEVHDCYKSLIKRAHKGQNHGSEILVEILLSLVSKPSLLLRKTAHDVFETFASFINAEGLQSMSKVLETDEDITGQAEMFELLDEEPEGTASSDVDDQSTDEDEANSSGTDDHLTAEGEEDGSDKEDEELAAFNAKLAEALGTRKDKEGSDANDRNESSDEDMNDEEMEALEPHLTQIFRDRKNIPSKRVERKEAKENIVNFKIRVLDLVEIYLKRQYTNVLATNLLIPLLTSIRKTKAKHISTRICKLIQDYFRRYRPKDKLNATDGPTTLDTLRKLLDQIHAAAIKHSSNAYNETYSNASLLVSKIILVNGGNMVDIDQRYELTRRISKEDPGCKVKPAMFESWKNWRLSMVNNLQRDITA